MRQPMTPAEFDAACRALRRRVPELHCTSTDRTPEGNARANGLASSKHLLDMARDYVAPMEKLKQAAAAARILGLWVTVHDVGSGDHLHVQGLPPGDAPTWWMDKYGGTE